MKGKRRKVVALLSQNRERGLVRFYRWNVRLECGHEAKVSARNRYAKGETPSIGYCLDCDILDVEAG